LQKKLFTALGLTVVVMFTLSACARRGANDNLVPATNEQTNTTPATNTSDIPAQTTSDATGTGLPANSTTTKAALIKETQTATDSIKQVQPDAQLVLVSMKFINSFSDLKGLATNYFIFRSPVDTRYYFLVDVPRNGEKARRFLTPREDFEFQLDLLPIDFANWKQSYVDAIAKAEAQGGADFRGKHASWEATVILGQPAGQSKLAWNVTYRATDGSGEEFKVWVDAATGAAEVVK
jgi:hypothetical protein